MILGIAGRKGSGKDTAADFLVDNYRFLKLAFASPLKEGIRRMFNLSYHQCYGQDKEIVDKRYGKTPRELFQYFGYEIIQFELPKFIPNLGRTFWCDRMEETINGIKSDFDHMSDKPPYPNFVISDVRFVHEAEFIHSMGGYIIKLGRITDTEDGHQSENEINWIKQDVWYDNNGMDKDEFLNAFHLIFREFVTKVGQERIL